MVMIEMSSDRDTLFFFFFSFFLENVIIRILMIIYNPIE